MKERIKAVVAETSPIIAMGIAGCLRRIASMNLTVIEARSIDELRESVLSESPDLLIVNPTFQGSFNPDMFRQETKGDFRTVAIETGKLDPIVRSHYDGAISIVDSVEMITGKISRLLDSGENQDSGEGENARDALSTREKEIVRYVVKGFTNKEIADKLYLSPHTVITHRRNIARKLDIHSSTGLTIYAIVNKLVDLSDIRL